MQDDRLALSELTLRTKTTGAFGRRRKLCVGVSVGSFKCGLLRGGDDDRLGGLHTTLQRSRL